MKLKAILHHAQEGGYWAEVPSLPGCLAQGETMAEIELNLHEAIEAWLLAAEPDAIQIDQQLLEIAV